MNDKQLSKLAIAALVLLIAAVIVSKLTRNVAQPSLYGAPLIQGLAPEIVNKVILGPDRNPATLQRQEGRFIALERGNYPVTNQALNRLIYSCLDATIVQAVTDNPENHQDLGVTQEQARSIVRFYDHENKLIVGLLVGNRAENNRGVYVRRFDSDTVYLSGDLTNLKTAITEYLNKQLFRLETSQIQRIEVALEQDFYAIIPDALGTPMLETPPADTTPNQNEIGAAFEALVRLDFADVLVDPAIAVALNFNQTYTCKLNTGITYTIEIAQHNQKYYIQAKALFNPNNVTLQAETEEAQNQAVLQARQTVRRFNQAHDDWIYKLDQWQAEKILKPLASLATPTTEPAP